MTGPEWPRGSIRRPGDPLNHAEDPESDATTTTSTEPDLFGEAPQQREAAIRDYNAAMGSGLPDMTLAYHLQNNGDAASRAELMKQIADSGRLEMWAEEIGGYGDQWSDAVKPYLWSHG